MSGRSEVSGSGDDVPKHAQPPPLAAAPVAATSADPNTDPHFYDEVSYRELHELRK